MGSIDVPDPPCGTAACATLVAHLVAAAETRDVIGMAKGMIMARSRCGPAAAFDALRRASMRENVKLRVIASRMVAAAEVADGSASGDALLATT